MLWMAERLEEEGDRMLQVLLVLWEGLSWVGRATWLPSSPQQY